MMHAKQHEFLQEPSHHCVHGTILSPFVVFSSAALSEMPKARRRREEQRGAGVVKRKSSEHKERLVARVREALDRHPRALVLRHRNMRNANLKDVRQYVKSRGGQVFLGSTKVLAVALGKDAPSEYKPNISQLSHRLKGHVALLITDMHLHDVHELLRETTAPQFARVGETAPKSVSFSAGPLTWDGEEHVPASLEPRLRNLGLPVRLNRGTLELTTDFTVCNENERLSKEQASILRQFGYTFAHFEMVVDSVWDEQGSEDSDGEIHPSFKVVSEPDENDKLVQVRRQVHELMPLETL
jgi:mRNA turnover protein 4